MKCLYVVVSPEQSPQQCGEEATTQAYQSFLCPRHLEVINKGGWLNRPGETKPVHP